HKSGSKKRRLQGSCDMCKKKKVKCDSAMMPDRCSNCIAFDYACTHNTAKRIIAGAKKPDYDSTATSVQNVFTQFKSTRDLMLSVLSNPSSSKILPDDPKIAKQQLIDLCVYARHLEHELLESSASPFASSNGMSKASPSSLRTPTPPANSPSPSTEVYVPSTERPSLHEEEDEPNPNVGGASGDQKVEELIGSFDKLLFDGNFVESDSNLAKREEFWASPPWYDLNPANLPSLIFPPPGKSEYVPPIGFEFLRHPQTFSGTLFPSISKTSTCILPLLHQPTFERQVSEGLHFHDRWFGQCVLAVCSNGSRYCDDERVLLEGASPELAKFSAGHKYFSQIDLSLCIHRSFNRAMSVSIYELQTCCVSIKHKQNTTLVPMCFAVLGLAVRLAQSAGAHRAQGKLSVERELWRRAFWVLVWLDTLLSGMCSFFQLAKHLPNPRATNPLDYDLSMIAQVDDEYWEHPDATKAFQQPLHKPSKVTAFVFLVRLFDILGYAQRTIYSVRHARQRRDEDWVKQCLVQINDAMEKWRSSLPDHLRWDPKRQDLVYFNQSAFLHSTYHAVQIEIVTPFLSGPSTSPLVASCLATAAQSARICLGIMEKHSVRGFLLLPVTQISVFISAMIIVISMWDGRRSGVGSDAGDHLDYLEKAIKILRPFENRWQVGGRLIDIITHLSTQDILPSVPIEERARLKRPRDHDFDEDDSPSIHDPFPIAITSSNEPIIPQFPVSTDYGSGFNGVLAMPFFGITDPTVDPDAYATLTNPHLQQPTESMGIFHTGFNSMETSSNDSPSPYSWQGQSRGQSQVPDNVPYSFNFNYPM
ncbi:hypothetical protein DL96DRAFT_1588376, partial [Flagelloscypha sp. PMI_526]